MERNRQRGWLSGTRAFWRAPAAAASLYCCAAATSSSLAGMNAHRRRWPDIDLRQRRRPQWFPRPAGARLASQGETWQHRVGTCVNNREEQTQPCQTPPPVKHRVRLKSPPKPRRSVRLGLRELRQQGRGDAGLVLLRAALPADGQHLRLLAARRRHQPDRHRLHFLGRLRLCLQGVLVAAGRSRRRALARPARTTARLDALLPDTGGDRAARDGVGGRVARLG